MVRLPVFVDDRGTVTAMRDRRVLVYWPHGFGDFVHFSFVAPLLEPSNTYFIARFGDDFVHLYDEGDIVKPLYSGVRAIGDGSQQGAAPHFGLDFDHLRSGEHDLDIPEPLRTRMHQAGIDAVLACRYPELTGRVPYPWQTKARYLAHQLVAPERLETFDLSKPLRSSLAFDAPVESQRRIEGRLREIVTSREKLYVLSPGGHTQIDKSWPEYDVMEFARALRKRDPSAKLVCVDERTSERIGRDPTLAPTTTDLFAGLDLPFAHVLLTLVRVAHAFAGVAAGPLHAALAIGNRPVVGLWLAHWPEYYDEPTIGALHLVGPNVYLQRLDRRIGAVTKAQAEVLPYAIQAFQKHPPKAADVLDAFAALGAY
jgi:hypothetical protein